MRFLDTILRSDPEARGYRADVRRQGRGVGDGVDAADLALFGPMVFARTNDEEA